MKLFLSVIKSVRKTIKSVYSAIVSQFVIITKYDGIKRSETHWMCSTHISNNK